MNRTLKAIAILGVLALIVLIGGVAAFAQSDAPAGATSVLAQVEPEVQDSAPDTVAPAGNGYGQRRGAAAGQGLLAVDQDEMHAAIAGVLGITVEELDAALAGGQTLVTLAQEQGVEIEAVREAMAAARAEALEQAVADGTITEEEAAWMQNRAGGPANRGNLGGGPGMGPGPRVGDAPGLGFVDEAEMHAAIAAALGISVEELEAAQAEGTPLAVLAQELGVELPVVREAMAAIREAAIDQALADGIITAEQAEWLQNRPAFGSASGAGMGNHGSGPGWNNSPAGRGRGQQGRVPDELTGVGSGNGSGFGRMHTP